MKITAGHQQVMPYMIVADAEAFLDFAKHIFNAQEIVRNLDTKKRISYSEIKIGESTMMLMQATPQIKSNSSCFYVYVMDTDETFYKALQFGATSLMLPMNEADDTRSAGFQDPFGNTWWVSTLV
ncbi:VOC family protein [Zhouia sp. PK063]|uniref:VOC family protein n=1 Tax=Zhouia sp. PK063 TaxID=3373602 RepID=UPI003796D7A7